MYNTYMLFYIYIDIKKFKNNISSKNISKDYEHNKVV